MSVCAIAGINWGDEGKGRMVDLLTEEYDCAVRCQGGGNAGHSIVNEYGRHALHLIPSGIFRKNVINILGNGVAVDPENLWLEIEDLRRAGVSVTPDNLKISDRASLLFPWHRLQDELEENRLRDRKYGSTRQGIAPFYADKALKKTVTAGELFFPEALSDHLAELLEWKNLMLTGMYGIDPVSPEELAAWVETYRARLLPFICDTGSLLRRLRDEGKNILFEMQLGALRDPDFGIIPYTTSSYTLAAYAPIGSGLTDTRPDRVVGVIKAYSTCVGEGPFTCEIFGKEAEKLREAGAEYGAKTGRPRRVGPLDLPASAYGVKLQGATELALTKIDVLSYLEEIPVCAEYELDGRRTKEFPHPSVLPKARPVLDRMEGWCCDIRSARSWEQLPRAARKYVERIEESTGCPVRFISVGPEREAVIRR